MAPDIYYGKIKNELIEAYDKSDIEKKLHLFDVKKKNIAIHIRVINECDDLHEHVNYENYTGRFHIYEEDYIKVINSLKNKYPNCLIHIFSQQSIYKKYKSVTEIDDVKLHIDIDVFDTFHHLCKADVLLISKSSFSYLAGLYNKNKVIYIPFWHSPLKDWEVIGQYI